MKIGFWVTFCIIERLTDRSTEAQPSSTDTYFIVFLFSFKSYFQNLNMAMTTWIVLFLSLSSLVQKSFEGNKITHRELANVNVDGCFQIKS